MNRTEQRQVYLEDTYAFSISTPVLADGKLDDGRYWVAVRDNIAHPQGGGQPADVVEVQGHPATPRRHQIESAGSHVVLVLETESLSVKQGDEVTVAVDPPTRLLHAALHTAGHVVDAAVRKRGFTHLVSNHFPEQARIEFEATQALDEAEAFVAAVQANVDTWMGGELPTSTYERDGRRFVIIGDISTDECSGTHVANTAELRDTTIRSAKVKKGRLKVGYSAAYDRA